MDRRKVGNGVDSERGVDNGVNSRRVGIIDDDRATRARSDNNPMAVATGTPTRSGNGNGNCGPASAIATIAKKAPRPCLTPETM